MGRGGEGRGQRLTGLKVLVVQLLHAHLCDHDVAVGSARSFDVAVQDVLWDLGGLAAACGPPDDDHRVVVDGAHDFLLKAFDRQLVPLHQDLNHKHRGSTVWSGCGAGSGCLRPQTG